MSSSFKNQCSSVSVVLVTPSALGSSVKQTKKKLFWTNALDKQCCVLGTWQFGKSFFMSVHWTDCFHETPVFCETTFKSQAFIFGTLRCSSFVFDFSLLTSFSVSSFSIFLFLLLLRDLWPGSFRRIFFMLALDLRKLLLK